MRMWFWYGYDLGEFLFSGLDITSQWAFALTWLALFLVAVLFEGSKVYLARAQREAQLQFYPYRSDERRNLLCEREQQGNNAMDASSTRNTVPGPETSWASLKLRLLVTFHQTAVFVSHNVVGYLLMLAVMVYNAHLLLAVVLGMMLGYFLFGTKLTRMQMQCFGTKRRVICTPECDDTAENSTPPLLTTSIASESDLFICRTRTCIQPSHYFPSGSAQEPGCHYGADKCPSRVARARRLHTTSRQAGTGDGPPTEDGGLLSSGCCKSQEPPPPPEPSKCCSSSSSHAETTVQVHEPHPQPAASSSCCKETVHPQPDSSSREETLEEHADREASPQISCCHAKSVSTESQEQIVR